VDDEGVCGQAADVGNVHRCSVTTAR